MEAGYLGVGAMGQPMDAKEWFGDYDSNRLDEQPIKDRLARIANRRRTARKKAK
jgi:hypothetical protein